MSHSHTESSVGSTTSPAVDAVVQVSFAVLVILTATAAEHDLSVTQLRLFGILRDRTPTMAAIADFLALDRSSVSGLIDRAERRGIVTRHASPDDGRVTIVELTAQGRRLADEGTRAVGERVERLLGTLESVDRAHLVRIASAVLGRPLE